MRLTANRMIKAGCCTEGVEVYFAERKTWDAEKLLALALKNEDFSNAIYGISFLMTKEQNAAMYRKLLRKGAKILLA